MRSSVGTEDRMCCAAGGESQRLPTESVGGVGPEVAELVSMRGHGMVLFQFVTQYDQILWRLDPDPYLVAGKPHDGDYD